MRWILIKPRASSLEAIEVVHKSHVCPTRSAGLLRHGKIKNSSAY
jgi:hypothetical protein